MTATEPRAEDLRRAFQDVPEGAEAVGPCPTVDRILDAVRGTASPGANRAVADHAATCPACATAWRLAREYVGADNRRAAIPTTSRARVVGIAASILIAVGLGVPFLTHGPVQPPPSPAIRAVPFDVVSAITPEGAILPLDAFVLRWTAGPEGSKYDVHVTDTSLERIAVAIGIDATEFTVPPDALTSMVGGDTVLWQVAVVYPDGRRVPSPTFSIQVE